MKKSLLALALGTFGLGMAEYVIMGILPFMAADFRVSIPEAGQFISAYALGVCTGAPLVAIALRKWPLRRILCLLCIVMLAMSAAMAVCPVPDTDGGGWQFPLMLAFRFIGGLPHGAYFGVGSIIADRISKGTKSTFAVAMMCSGMTVANLVGIPVGTLLTEMLSWRLVFALACLCNIAALIAIILFVPHVGALPDNGVKGTFRFLKSPAPWLLITATIMGNGGVFCWYSYISPTLTQLSGVPAGWMPAMMVLAGAGMVLGNLAGGRLADRFGPGRTGRSIEIAIFSCLLLISLTAQFRWCSILLMFITCAGLFAVSAPQQLLLIRFSKGGELMGGAMVQLAFNFGNALGAWLGGLPIVESNPSSYNLPAAAGACMAAVGIACYVIFCRKYEPSGSLVSGCGKAMKILVAAILIGSTATLAQAQEDKKGKWNGDFQLDAGTNFKMSPQNQNSRNMGNLSAKIGRSGKKFEFDVMASASIDYLFTGSVGLDVRAEGGDTTGVIDATATEVRNLAVKTGASLRWIPNRYNRFTLEYSYGYDRGTPKDYTLSDGNIHQDTLKASFAMKDADNDVNVHKLVFNYERSFRKSESRLTVDADMNYSRTANYSEWITGTGEKSKEEIIRAKEAGGLSEEERRNGAVIERRYRDTPSQRVSVTNARVKYEDKNFCRIKNLDFNAALNLKIRGLEDHRQSANYVDGQWRDSIEVRENFLYRTSALTPSVYVGYEIGKYEVNFSYSPELFLRQLDSDSKKGDITKGDVAHVFSMNNSFTPWEGHSFFLNGGRSESRPDYLQICWFPRQSIKYSNEVYKGNPDLHNEVRAAGELGYRLSKSKFNTSFTISHVYKHGKIEQTYSTEEYDGREYRVYTWVNGGKSHETSGTLNVGWDGDALSAHVEGSYNLYRGVNMSGDETRSGDYSVRAAAEYRLKTWSFAADMAYQSDLVRDYSTLKSLVNCNARITKKFKHFTLTLDGRDLFDKPLEILTKSSDGTELRYEKTVNNKRLFILGVHYSF